MASLSAVFSILQCIFMFIFQSQIVNGFSHKIFKHRNVFRNSLSKIEDGISINSLRKYDIEAVYLSNTIRRWLNNEFINLPIHSKIGEWVAHQYMLCRERGVNDLGELVLDFGSRLELENLDDSFVNAWDVANKASDFLLLLLQRELCECSGDLSLAVEDAKALGLIPKETNITKDPPGSWKRGSIYDSIDTEAMKRTILNYTSEFSRYKFLKEFLEDERTWSDLQLVIAILLGYRLNQSDNLYLDEDLILVNWEDLSSTNSIPDFSNLNDHSIDMKLDEALPPDTESVDLIIEALVGLEAFKAMKQTSDRLVQRKILIVKWMFVHGFINCSFPPKEKYIPLHIQDQL